MYISTRRARRTKASVFMKVLSWLLHRCFASRSVKIGCMKMHASLRQTALEYLSKALRKVVACRRMYFSHEFQNATTDRLLFTQPEYHSASVQMSKLITAEFDLFFAPSPRIGPVSRSLFFCLPPRNEQILCGMDDQNRKRPRIGLINHVDGTPAFSVPSGDHGQGEL